MALSRRACGERIEAVDDVDGSEIIRARSGFIAHVPRSWQTGRSDPPHPTPMDPVFCSQCTFPVADATAWRNQAQPGHSDIIRQAMSSSQFTWRPVARENATLNPRSALPL